MINGGEDPVLPLNAIAWGYYGAGSLEENSFQMVTPTRIETIRGDVVLVQY